MNLVGGQPDNVERRLHALRGDAARAPDLSESILMAVGQQRPFATQRQLRMKRWGRIVSSALAVGLAVCAGMVAAQWHAIAPGLASPLPISGVVQSAAAEVQESALALRNMPGQLVLAARRPMGDDELPAVRAVTTRVLVPMSGALGIVPSTEGLDPRVALAEQILRRGQKAWDGAERIASSIKLPLGGGSGGLEGSSMMDRFERALGGQSPGGRAVGDVGPQ